MNNSLLKNLRDLFGIVIVAVIFLLIALMIPGLVSSRVVPPVDISLDQWVDKFTATLMLIWMFSTVITVVRYIFEAWIIRNKIDTQRLRWVFFLVMVVVFAIIQIILSKTNNPTTEGNFAVGSSFIFLGLANYYFATALFSPVGIKYSAPLSIYLRRFW